jgi:hypothetical protein
MKEPYRDWAESQIAKVKGVLAASRAEHTQAVKERINSVEKMKDVVSITEGLFALSKVRLHPIVYPTVFRQCIAIYAAYPEFNTLFGVLTFRLTLGNRQARERGFRPRPEGRLGL